MKQFQSNLTKVLLLSTLFVSLGSFDLWAAKKDLKADSMMGENIGGGFGDFHIEAKDAFNKNSREVIWFSGFKGFIGAPQANLSAQWITPAGETFKTEKFTTQYGNSRFGWAKLDIKGQDKAALELEGEWTVKVYWDEELIDTKRFYLGEKKFKQAEPPPVLAQPRETASTVEGHMKLAKAYFAKNDMNRSIQELMRAQQIAPDSSESYLVLGAIYNLVNKPDEAILQFTKAKSLKGDAITVHRGLGNAYINLNLIEDAIKEYEALLKIRPDSEKDATKLKEMKQSIDKKSELNAKLSSEAQDSFFVEILADKMKVSVAEPVTLRYVLFLKESGTYKGFYKVPEIKGHTTNILMPDPDDENQNFFEERSIFGLVYAWDDTKKMMRITDMKAGSPCKGLLEIGDHIISIDGAEITGADQLTDLTRSRDLSKETLFLAKRQDQSLSIKIVPMRSFSESTVLNKEAYVGFDFEAQFFSDKGLCVIKNAEGLDLKVGDVIRQVDGLSMATPGDWRKILNMVKVSRLYAFTVLRNGQEQLIKAAAHTKKPVATAQFMPKTDQFIKREETIKNKMRYVKATVETIKLTFSSPGTYTIDPGSLSVRADSNKKTEAIVYHKPIEITVV